MSHTHNVIPTDESNRLWCCQYLQKCIAVAQMPYYVKNSNVFTNQEDTEKLAAFSNYTPIVFKATMCGHFLALYAKKYLSKVCCSSRDSVK